MSRNLTAKEFRELTNPSEATIEAKCTEYLEADGWRSLKTDPVSDRSRGKGFGEPGMADRLYIRYGYIWPVEYEGKRAVVELLWIEWKKRGGKVAKHQSEWHAIERARGALVWVAKVDFEPSINGFITHYKQSGLARKVR